MSAASIDFLRDKPAASKLGWGLFGLGVAALCAALWLEQRWAAQRAEHEARLQAREEAARQAARRTTPRRTPPSPEQRRLQRIAPQLRQPWLPTLRVIENATEAPIYLSSLSIDPAAGLLQLEGQAPSFDHALAYSQTLDEEGLLGPAELRSHEQLADAGGPPAVRFLVVTRWRVR